MRDDLDADDVWPRPHPRRTSSRPARPWTPGPKHLALLADIAAGDITWRHMGNATVAVHRTERRPVVTLLHPLLTRGLAVLAVGPDDDSGPIHITPAGRDRLTPTHEGAPTT